MIMNVVRPYGSSSDVMRVIFWHAFYRKKYAYDMLLYVIYLTDMIASANAVMQSRQFQFVCMCVCPCVRVCVCVFYQDK